MSAVEFIIIDAEDVTGPRWRDLLVPRAFDEGLLHVVDLFYSTHVGDAHLVGTDSDDGA
jgi:hypothetical protein